MHNLLYSNQECDLNGLEENKLILEMCILCQNKKKKNLRIYSLIIHRIFYQFCSDLMCNKDIKGYKFVCVGVEVLAFNVLMHTTKSYQKVIDN